MTLSQQFDSAQAASFEFIWSSGRAHEAPPGQSIGHLLCRNQ
jgi:hypothetical protein